MESLHTLQWILFAAALIGLGITTLELISLWRLRRTRLPAPPTWPSVTIIKPLCGMDDDLEANLESHLKIDYPGEWEVLLGVRSPEDQAFPVARRFADAHPERVRLVLQDGEPGHNPKVNQLITLTRAGKGEIIALTDSNVRVEPSYLREVASALALPGVGLATQVIAGVGERRLGAVLDNLTLAYFAATNLAASSILMKWDHVVGKSMALRRDLLEKIGGWHEVKDHLAEDHLLGSILRYAGFRSFLCPTPIQNVQIHQPLQYFWSRHSRWLMIRYRTFFPGVLGEPLLLPVLLSLLGALAWPLNPWGWLFFAAAYAWEAVMVQLAGRLVRGYGFKPWHLSLLVLREAMFFGAWARAMTMRHVNWRGTRLLVLTGTRLAEEEALERVRNIQRLRS